MRLVILAALVASPALARPASTGWFAEGGLGTVNFLGKVAPDAAIGPALDLRLGRDLFPWLSVGLELAGSTHEATLPPPPDGQWFQLYRGGADVRIGGRFDRLSLFAEGLFGGTFISSNVLEKVMITKPAKSFSVTIQGGAGLEYQLENRHYGFGLAADFFIEPQFASMEGIDTRVYLRYTY